MATSYILSILFFHVAFFCSWEKTKKGSRLRPLPPQATRVRTRAAAPPSGSLPLRCRLNGLPATRAARSEGGGVAPSPSSEMSGRARLAGHQGPLETGLSRRQKVKGMDPAWPRPDPVPIRRGRVLLGWGTVRGSEDGCGRLVGGSGGNCGWRDGGRCGATGGGCGWRDGTGGGITSMGCDR